MATITVPGMFLTGDHASRPAATAVGSGSLYSCTDHDLIYQSDGASWTTWATVGGPGVAGAVEQLYDSTLGGTATEFDTGATLAGANHLLIKFIGRSDRAGQVFEGINVQFNADTGSNYDMINIDWAESGAGGIAAAAGSDEIGQTSGFIGATTGATGVASSAGQFEAAVHGYGGTTFHKTWDSHGAVKYASSATNMHHYVNSGVWRSTAAITRVRIFTRNGSNFIAGSRLTIYGIT